MPQPQQTTPKQRPFIQRKKLDDGTEHVHFDLHAGQQAALNSHKPITLILAGVRSGKTVVGPLWLFQRMRQHGPGDYLMAAPTYPIIDKAAAPEIEHVLGRILKIGSLKKAPLQFHVSEAGERYLWPNITPERPTRIIFGHADDPESLEAMTVKDAWIDEGGQKKFKADSFENIRARLAIDRGRLLMTTRPYSLGWLYQKLYKRWDEANRQHPEIEVINFASTMNPVFPQEEDDRARRDLPPWKYRMMYKGLFERPAGLIYDNFDTNRHIVPRFSIPTHWRRYLGLDFGGVNTAGIFFAGEMDSSGTPTGRVFAYREYWAGSRTAQKHTDALLEGESCIPDCVGGSKSEGQWRAEFGAAGLPVREPVVKDVEVGINRVYGFHSRDELFVFSDLQEYLDQKATYSRKLDEQGEPTEEIDDKETFHLLDAERYILSWVSENRGEPLFGHPRTEDEGRSVFEVPPVGVWNT